MKPSLIAALLAMAALAGCDNPPWSTPVVVPSAQKTALYTYPMPLCLIFCTSHISAIREEAIATGSGSLTTGASSNSSTSSSSGNVQGSN